MQTTFCTGVAKRCSKPFQRSEKQRQELASNHIASALLTSVTYSQAMLTGSCQICESVATKDTAQQSMCDHSKAPAHMRSIEIDLPPNTNAQALIHIAYMGQILLKQALQPVVSMHNTVMYTLLPTLATSAWLSLSVLATAMSIHAETSRPSKYVPSPQVMQTCVIFVSLLSIAANVTMFILTQVHCMLTVAAACSFLAQPHWITACLIMLYRTAHTGEELGTRQDDCINNLCTGTSRFYVGCTISYNSQHLSNLTVQNCMRANLKKNVLHTCKVKQSVKRQETRMLQHNTSLTTIGTLTVKSAEQHVHIIAGRQMLLSILETKRNRRNTQVLHNPVHMK